MKQNYIQFIINKTLFVSYRHFAAQADLFHSPMKSFIISVSNLGGNSEDRWKTIKFCS